MAKTKMTPKEKYLVFNNAAVVAFSAKKNANNGKYDTKD